MVRVPLGPFEGGPKVLDSVGVAISPYILFTSVADDPVVVVIAQGLHGRRCKPEIGTGPFSR